MRQIVTPNGYLAIERLGGIDVYSSGDCLVCELSGKQFVNFTYDDKVDGDKLDEAIEDEINQYC